MMLMSNNLMFSEQPHDRKPIAPSPEIESKRVEIKSPRADTALSLEDQAEMSAFNAFNEQRELERINKYVHIMIIHESCSTLVVKQTLKGIC